MPRSLHSIHCKSGDSMLCGASELWKIDLKSVGPGEFQKILRGGGKKSKITRTVAGKTKSVVVTLLPCGRCRIAFEAKGKAEVKSAGKGESKSQLKTKANAKVRSKAAVKKANIGTKPKVKAKAKTATASPKKPKSKTRKPKASPPPNPIDVAILGGDPSL